MGKLTVMLRVSSVLLHEDCVVVELASLKIDETPVAESMYAQVLATKGN
jgi:hypothetical protein